MDAETNVESIDFNALGGADTITVNDMSGTDVTDVNINLAGANGLGDGQADTIVINATSGNDVAVVFGDAGGVSCRSSDSTRAPSLRCTESRRRARVSSGGSSRRSTALPR